jgi:hypothetical protein
MVVLAFLIGTVFHVKLLAFLVGTVFHVKLDKAQNS